MDGLEASSITTPAARPFSIVRETKIGDAIDILWERGSVDLGDTVADRGVGVACRDVDIEVTDDDLVGSGATCGGILNGPLVDILVLRERRVEDSDAFLRALVESATIGERRAATCYLPSADVVGAEGGELGVRRQDEIVLIRRRAVGEILASVDLRQGVDRDSERIGPGRHRHTYSLRGHRPRP